MFHAVRGLRALSSCHSSQMYQEDFKNLQTRPFVRFCMRVACENVVVGSLRINGKETPFHTYARDGKRKLAEAIVDFPTRLCNLCNTGITDGRIFFFSTGDELTCKHRGRWDDS